MGDPVMPRELQALLDEHPSEFLEPHNVQTAATEGVNGALGGVA